MQALQLDGPLDAQPQDVQIQYLKQIIYMQQHMLAAQATAESNIEFQNRQLQLLSGEMSTAANARIVQLEKALSQHILKEQASLLVVENAALKSQWFIRQMST